MVCFLVDVRDTERAALQPEKVADLRKSARAQGVKNMATAKKGVVLDHLVKLRCPSLSIFMYGIVQYFTYLDCLCVSSLGYK